MIVLNELVSDIKSLKNKDPRLKVQKKNKGRSRFHNGIIFYEKDKDSIVNDYNLQPIDSLYKKYPCYVSKDNILFICKNENKRGVNTSYSFDRFLKEQYEYSYYELKRLIKKSFLQSQGFHKNIVLILLRSSYNKDCSTLLETIDDSDKRKLKSHGCEISAMLYLCRLNGSITTPKKGQSLFDLESNGFFYSVKGPNGKGNSIGALNSVFPIDNNSQLYPLIKDKKVDKNEYIKILYNLWLYNKLSIDYSTLFEMNINDIFDLFKNHNVKHYCDKSNLIYFLILTKLKDTEANNIVHNCIKRCLPNSFYFIVFDHSMQFSIIHKDNVNFHYHYWANTKSPLNNHPGFKIEV